VRGSDLPICRRGVAFQTVVLIDGVRFAEPKTEFSVGVATANTYTVKKVDLDYFGEE
jgi:restriction endonuclease Mrr